jgi:GNAT superfamily N-acetyltransferase
MNPFPSIVPDLSLNPSRIGFGEVSAGDFDEVLELRISAMKESLDRVGRFDPQRARERLKDSFYPQHSSFILLDSGRIGFHTFRPTDEGFHLDHLYIHPLCQGLGIGSYVMSVLISHAKEKRKPIRLGALRDSGSNAFYERHGFVKISEEEWDIHYVRTVES